MRLFIAVLLSEENKNALAKTAKKLSENCRGGNFTRCENFHLTLVFIGEVSPSRISDIKVAMDIDEAPFDFTVKGFGNFGSVYWVGAGKCEAMERIAKKLSENLLARGYDIDRKPFRAHFTLGREVKPEPGFNPSAFAGAVPGLSQTVTKISLMESSRINGKLTYTEIYHKELK